MRSRLPLLSASVSPEASEIMQPGGQSPRERQPSYPSQQSYAPPWSPGHLQPTYSQPQPQLHPQYLMHPPPGMHPPGMYAPQQPPQPRYGYAQPQYAPPPPPPPPPPQQLPPYIPPPGTYALHPGYGHPTAGSWPPPHAASAGAPSPYRAPEANAAPYSPYGFSPPHSPGAWPAHYGYGPPSTRSAPAKSMPTRSAPAKSMRPSAVDTAGAPDTRGAGLGTMTRGLIGYVVPPPLPPPPPLRLACRWPKILHACWCC